MSQGESRRSVVVMGVSGSGKSTIGASIAAALALRFVDGDSLHLPASVSRMRSGVPLTDDDRWPWLDAIGKALGAADGGMVVACSALRRIYRDRLTATAGRPVLFVLLSGSRQTIGSRIGGRKGHFMPPSLLDSQFATLEPPAPEELAVSISVEPPLEAVVDAALAALPALRARADAASLVSR